MEYTASLPKQVIMERRSENWSPWKQWVSDPIVAIEWLAKHGYKAYRVKTTKTGKRVGYFRKQDCKTEYVIYFQCTATPSQGG